MKQYLEQLSSSYYSGTPLVTNEEYDALEQIYGQCIAGSGDVDHSYRMFSLKKHYDKDGALPLQKSLCAKTVKLDGAAVSILYIDGTYSHALTRGNGVQGRDISLKALSLNIPEHVPLKGIIQITGEVVALKTVENSRNYASGALNQKGMDVWEQRKTDGNMKFVAYNVQAAQNRWGYKKTYLEDMRMLYGWDFSVISIPEGLGVSKTTPWEAIYPTDGLVYRLDDNSEFNKQGFTDKFPRGAIAWKEEQESVETVLLSVEWGVGKSGKVTPVAILEPVLIGEANVSRATLNNMSYIKALDLELGCTVQVIRSGEIIPKIVGRLY